MGWLVRCGDSHAGRRLPVRTQGNRDGARVVAMGAAITAALRTRLWLVAGWECRGRRLSKG
jgi:hypothetical protein